MVEGELKVCGDGDFGCVWCFFGWDWGCGGDEYQLEVEQV